MQTLLASGPAAPIARAVDPAPAGSSILALDLGTTMGWAIHTAEGVILSGTVSFKPSRYGGGMRYLRFRAWLEELAEDSGGLSAIYYEEVRRHLGTDAAHVYGGLLATLTAGAEQRRVPYAGTPVGAIKSFATGRGNAGKPDVIAAVRARRYAPGQITAYGESLGAAVSVELARRRAPARLVLEHAFLSVPELGAQVYPWLPVRLLSRIHYDSLADAPELRMPVLVVHSPEDELVPIAHGRKLYDALPGPKRFLETGGGHNDGGFLQRAEWRHAVRRFLNNEN